MGYRGGQGYECVGPWGRGGKGWEEYSDEKEERNDWIKQKHT